MKILFFIALFILSAEAHCGCQSVRSSPFTLNDASSCLRDQAYRKKVESAALSGNAEAASLLADYYMDGAGDDRGEAIHWLRVYSKNSGEAPIILGQMLLNSNNGGDIIEGEEILLRKAKSGDVVAAELIADHMASSNRSLDAVFWYERASLAGRRSAMIKLGNLLLAEDKVSYKYFGVMWTLVAASQFPDESFMRKQLLEKAKKEAFENNFDIENIMNFAFSFSFPAP